MTMTEFLVRLPGVKPVGNGWVAKCPSHDDRIPSLSIQEGADGRTLLKCHAGCATGDIVKAMGLQMKDLFVQARPHPMIRWR
jgi:hypothetical protein